MTKPNGKPPNVVDMADARRKQKTLRRQGAKAGQATPATPSSPLARRFWATVQVVLFMFVFYLGMRSCGGGGF